MKALDHVSPAAAIRPVSAISPFNRQDARRESSASAAPLERADKDAKKNRAEREPDGDAEADHGPERDRLANTISGVAEDADGTSDRGTDTRDSEPAGLADEAGVSRGAGGRIDEYV